MLRPFIKKLALPLILSIISTGASQAGVLIDDFSVYPTSSTESKFSAPNLGKNPTFLRQPGLDPKHVLGGTRSASLNAYSAIPIETTYDSEKKLARITFEKLSTGVASLSYQGGDMGEARDLNANLKAGGANSLAIWFVSAPSAGTAVISLYSGDKFETVSQPIKGKEIVIPFAAFKEIDFAHIDGLSVEIQIPRQINKKLVYEIGRIETRP